MLKLPNVAPRLLDALAAAGLTGVEVQVASRSAAGVRLAWAAPPTGQQAADAAAVVAALDYSEAADAAYDLTRNPERAALRDGAPAALAADQAYLDLAAPTNAQTQAHVQRLTRQVMTLIRRTAQLD